ncbi:GEVED domain-containing protein [Tenacibaculum aestuariivivum]|uniref:GEVED domain-containing protein n=1 Tax=Tenacibaculum aestuariivivum TaxID=2006131 RepID=UPI003AB2642D
MNSKCLKGLVFVSFVFGLNFQIQAQNKNEVTQIRSKYDLTKLQQLEGRFQKIAKTEKEEALQIAKQQGWKTKFTTKDGSFVELQRVVNGKPIYYTTFNVSASKSTRANHLNIGGSLGLNLMGQGITARVWDGGIARASHQEYDGAGGSNRFSAGDYGSINSHAAHVTGTIMASGVDANAKGMAPHSKVKGFDWNSDKAEATIEASNGMLISNHSYGYAARNQQGEVQLPQYYFGGYIDESRDWDEILFNAPNYLMVVAAGNDGYDNSANTNPVGGYGFDKLTGHSTSKNNLVVANANDATINSNGDLVSVFINSSSSEGPTDDFRIKPDITGNGTGVYSTYQSSDTAYNSITGTSMASPNVAGSLLLLQEHYKNLSNGNFMKAATLKGLALHTADDAGVSGPDAVFGWGLLHTKKAAEVITNKGNQSKVEELTLTSGNTYTITVESDGVNPLLASISWTDRPGITSTIINSTTPVLVNDLDIRVSKNGVTYFPYELTGATTSTKRDNNVDPYERVDVDNASGTYTITVTNKGSLVGGSQNYSLIVTGLTSVPVVCNATTPTEVSVTEVSGKKAVINWKTVPGATYDVRYRAISASSWLTEEVSVSENTLNDLSELTEYEVQVRSKCSSGNSNYSSLVNFTTTDVSLDYCTSKGNSANDEYIQQVVLGTINKVSTGENGYSDYTSVSTNLIKGSSNTLTITPNWSGSAYDEGYGVWIDYNNDGDFSDAGETIFTKSPSKDTSVTGSFTIPSSATNGATRMRIVLKYNAIPTACEASFPYGEVEDYTVVIVADQSDTKAPSAPTSLSALNIAQTTLTLNWSGSTDNVGVTGYEVYEGSTKLLSTTNTSTAVTGLTPNTSYSFSVKAVDAAANESASSNVLNITTLPAGLIYCVSKGASINDEHIQKVELGAISNTSGGNGYSDYTSVSTNLIKETSNTITITPKWSGAIYDEGYAVWIDYNNDGDFSDVGETVWTKEASKNTSVSGSFTVPLSAKNGETRMRVALKYNAIPQACEASFPYGEVEDYTVVIGEAENDTTAPSVPTNLSASKVTQTTLTLNWSVSTDNVGVTGYEVYEGATKIGATANTTIAITGLTANTSYSYSVKAIDTSGNESASSNVLNITTLLNDVTYCNSKGARVTYEWIDYVAFGGMTNETGRNGGYGDFTSKVATVALGSVNQLVVSAGFSKSTYNEHFTVWIDYNKDGDFTDAGEQIVTGNSSSAENRITNITIPLDAKLGETRMRVSMKFDTSSSPCEKLGDGEVEDYTVNIISTPLNTTTSNVLGENIRTQEQLDLIVYPNPSIDFIKVDFASEDKNITYKIINTIGKVVQKGYISLSEISVASLSAGMYIIEVNDGQKILKTKIIKK